MITRAGSPGCLATAAVFLFAPGPVSVAAGGSQPATVTVATVVRDFKRSHADFDVMPIGGPGHYAGNVALELGPADVPTLTGTGFKVASQWQDLDDHNIAPHLYRPGSGGGAAVVELVNGPVIESKTTIDTFDSSLPYGGKNVGPAPDFVTGAPMPEVTAPAGLPWTEDVKYGGKGTSTLSSSVHCKKFELVNGHTLKISGNVTIVADELFKATNDVEVELLAGATLDIYALKDIEFANKCDLNVNTGNPDLVTIYCLNDSVCGLSNETRVYANIIAPDGNVLIENNGQLYGSYTGKDFNIKNTAGFHVGTGPVLCGTPLNDSAGTAGVTSDGTITSASTFGQWFRDVLGTNFSTLREITLTRNAEGVYEFMDDEFHPIDGAIFGNEGDGHNNYFTLTLRAEFTYQACQEQFVSFFGADDAWLFVDGHLGLDLGGVRTLTEQRLEMDRLDLVDGQVYEMSLFYAQRQPNGAFHLRTNIPLVTPGVWSVSGLYD